MEALNINKKTQEKDIQMSKHSIIKIIGLDWPKKQKKRIFFQEDWKTKEKHKKNMIMNRHEGSMFVWHCETSTTNFVYFGWAD